MKVLKQGSSYKVQSSSEKGRFYTVDIVKRVCDCPAYRFRYQKKGLLCKHIEAALTHHEKLGDSGEEITDFVRKKGPIDSIRLISMFGEDPVNDLLHKGELIEKRGRISILD